jgi:hypothetical protein
MTPEHADRLGRLADQLDAMLYSARLPLAPAIHISAFISMTRDARDELASIVREATGENPWETNPLCG